MSRRLPGLPVLLLVLLAFATGLRAQAPVHGPIRTGEQNPVYRLLYTPDAEGADLIPAGEFRVEGGFGYTNIFELSEGEKHFALLDMERLTSNVVIRWAPSAAWEVGAGLRTGTDWGGFLDPFISGFHELFGFPNGGREKVADDQYGFVLIQRAQRVSFRLSQNRLALDDGRVFVKRALIDGRNGPAALSVRGILNLALGPDGVDGGRVDGAIELLGRRSFGPTHLHGGIGAMTLTPPDVLDVLTRERAYYLLAGVERHLTDRVSILAQMVGGTGYFEDFGTDQVDGFPMNLVVGVAGETGGGWGWQVSFSEDVPPGSPSSDFTVGVGISRSVGRD